MKKPLEGMVRFAITVASMGTWNGQGMTPYFQQCKHFDQGEGVLLIYSRDTGYHTSGWWLTGDINMSEKKFDAVLAALE